ncbi:MULTISPECIES: ferredoxin [unclassified Mycolicibacterium]|uniref:ferredoxin n=1 Tax=unclassified Mycolicibacterium TaxID=2636767 RepID=UPI001F4C42C6|nr:ferredoxin [Mycolicibacterium sp. YH-1]UNB51909.1 ferredoxin [Mycolicibacterium sp. YH-1]HET7740847.1 ferredoxin [Mycobacterium sp.]
MRLIVRSEHCMANGSCQRAAGEVFGNTPEGWVTLLDERPRAELHAAVVRAADTCPVGAIEIVEEAGDDNVER